MQVSLIKFADRVHIILDCGWLTNKTIDYELRNRELVYVTYR